MDKKKISKEEKQKEKEEKQTKIEAECATNLQEALKKFVSFTQKNQRKININSKEPFRRVYSYSERNIGPLEAEDQVREKFSTVDMVDFAIVDKVLSAKFVDALEVEDQTQLLKFFYLTYERFTQKKNTKNLKPLKIYKLNHQIVDKHGIGTVNRSLFALAKN